MITEFRDGTTTFNSYRKRMGQILANSGNERLTTGQIKERVIARARQDAKFRREMFKHPKFLWALVLEQQMGIKAEDFLRAIKKVELHQENEGLLYIKIPACHGGCKAPGVHPAPECHSGDSCHVCGVSFKARTPDGKCDGADNEPGKQRSDIERHIRERAAQESNFRDRLQNHPLETYVHCAQELMGGKTPEYLNNVREIILLEERPDEIHIVLPQVDSRI